MQENVKDISDKVKVSTAAPSWPYEEEEEPEKCKTKTQTKNIPTSYWENNGQKIHGDGK